MIAALPGRRQQLDDLIDLLQREGRRLIELCGVSGVGKSALSGALCQRLEEDYLVLQVRCGAIDSHAAHDTMLSRLLQVLEARLTPEDMGRLGEQPSTKPFFEVLRPAASGVADPPARDQFPLVDAVMALIRELGKRAPVLICLDDFQRADPAGRQLILSILEHPEYDELPLVVVAVHDGMEDAATGERWDLLVQFHPDSQRMLLEPLDHDGLSELVCSLLGSEIVQQLPELPDLLWSVSGGHPQLAVQHVTAARRRGALRATMEGWKLDPGWFKEPRDLESLLLESADAILSRHSHARFLLTWLQLAGGPVEIAPLERIAPGLKPGWAELADELARAGVIQQSRDQSGSEFWQFAHAAWSGAARSLLEPGERVEFIRQVLAGQDAGAFPASLHCELHAGLLLESGLPDAAERATSLLEECLGRQSRDAEGLSTGIRMRDRILSIASDRKIVSRVFRDQVAALVQLGDLGRLGDLLQTVGLDELDAAARVACFRHMPDVLRLRKDNSAILPWISGQRIRNDLGPEERAQLDLAELAERMANSGDDPRIDELLKTIDSESLDEDQRLGLEVMRVDRNALLEKNFAGAFKILADRYRQRGAGISPRGRARLLHEMIRFSRNAGTPNLFRPFAEDLLELTETAGYSSIHRRRSDRVNALIMLNRIEEAEQILRSDLRHFASRNQTRLARERTLNLVSLLRFQRKPAAAADLLRQTRMSLTGTPGDFFGRAFLLTSCSVMWRVYDTYEAARLLEVARDGGIESHAEFQISYHYSLVMTRLQQAERGGDWQLLREAAEQTCALYRDHGRDGVEAMHFDLVLARAMAELGGDDLRKAADYLPVIELARQRRDFELTRILVGVGEFAHRTGESTIEAKIAEELASCDTDRHLALLFLARRAGWAGDGPGKRRLLTAACCHARNEGLECFIDHALACCKVQEEFQPDPGEAPRDLAFYLYSLGEWMRRGLPVGFPGKSTPESREKWYAAEVVELRRRIDRLPAADQRPLSQKLEAFELALFESGNRVAGKPGLQLFLFNGPRMVHRGEEIGPDNFQSRVGFELLSCLAVRQWQGRPRVPRDELLELLRVDGDPMLSESSLRVVVSRVRKTLRELTGQDLLPAGHSGYCLEEGAIAWLDVAHFEQQARNATFALREGRLDHAGRYLDEAIHAYSGRFMERGSGDWRLSLASYFESRFVELARERLRLLRDRPVRAAALRADLQRKHPELIEYLPREQEEKADAT